MKKSLIFLALLMYATSGYAEYRWIKDTLYVPLRSGMGNSFRILDKGMISGTRLTLVEITEDEKDTWAKVKTDEGVEGWVRAQYLIDTPTAAKQLITANRKIKKLEARSKVLKGNLGENQSSNKQLNKDLNSAQSEAARLSKELAELKRVSGDSIALYTNHQKLMQAHQLIQTELDVVKADNERLKSNNDHQFFLSGVGAVLVGVILTLIVPRLRGRKKYSDWG